MSVIIDQMTPAVCDIHSAPRGGCASDTGPLQPTKASVVIRINIVRVTVTGQAEPQKPTVFDAVPTLRKCCPAAAPHRATPSASPRRTESMPHGCRQAVVARADNDRVEL
jgi:hypothetical protein